MNFWIFRYESENFRNKSGIFRYKSETTVIILTSLTISLLFIYLFIFLIYLVKEMKN